MILLDFSSVAMSSLMMTFKDHKNNPEMVRHTIFNIVRRYNAEYKKQYGPMILCFDSRVSWRRNYFPEYKAARAESRKKDDKDWKEIYRFFDEVQDELMEYSPFKCIKVEGCEADDIIGTLCEKSNGPEKILIISPDKDFLQLQRYPNVLQYSNIQKKWLECDNPKMELLEKILRGDTGDGIPNVLSENDSLINSDKRQNRLTKVVMEKLVTDPESQGIGVARNIIRNRTLIDLSRTPEEYKKLIMDGFEKPAKGSISRLITLFTKHRMSMLMNSLSDFEVS